MIDFNSNNSKIFRYDLRVNEAGNFHCRIIIKSPTDGPVIDKSKADTSLSDAKELTKLCQDKGIDPALDSDPNSKYVHYVSNEANNMTLFFELVMAFDKNANPNIMIDLSLKLNNLLISKFQQALATQRQEEELMPYHEEFIQQFASLTLLTSDDICELPNNVATSALSPSEGGNTPILNQFTINLAETDSTCDTNPNPCRLKRSKSLTLI